MRDFNYDLAQILRAEPAQMVARSIAAAHCHCTHECYAMTNILFNPRQYPALLKGYLQLWMQFGGLRSAPSTLLMNLFHSGTGWMEALFAAIHQDFRHPAPKLARRSHHDI